MDNIHEQDIPPISKYWAEVSDLTIYEAAFWMEFGDDPEAHELRCAQDYIYHDHFCEHPGGADAVNIKCGVIKSAVRAGLIKITGEASPNSNALTNKTYILKSDWLNWCRRQGYSELANRFELNVVAETLPVKKPSGGDIEEAADADTDTFGTTLAALFDPVPVESLEKMFPSEGQWKKWAERADRNKLKVAREGRAKFNPYKAAMWFVQNGAEGWDIARLNRTLANNLPSRSRDKAHLLKSDIA